MKQLFLILTLLTLGAIDALAQTQCVRLRELDGSPDVNCVRQINVTNGTLTCTGNICTLTTGGGGGGGSPGGADTNVQFNDSGSFGGESGFTYNKTSKVITNTGGIVVTEGTLTTTAKPILSGTATWNDAGTVHAGIQFTLTDTASDASSRVFSLMKGATTLFAIDKNGSWITSGALSFNPNAGSMSISGAANQIPLTLHNSVAGADDEQVLSLTSTWNTTGAVKGLIVGNVTDTASDAASLLIDLQVGGSSRFKVSKGGALTITGTAALVGVTASGAITQTSASATAFESGPNGGTNPVLRLVNNTASAATGLSITGNAAAAGVTINALSSGADERIDIQPKGNANVNLGNIAGNIFWSFNNTTGLVQGINGGGTSIVLRMATSSTVGFHNPSAGVLAWNSATNFNSGSLDTFMRRSDAANIALGAADVDTNAALVAQTLSVQNTLAGGTSDQAGKNFTIKGSQGKGTGAGGSLIFQTAPAGSTSTTVNSLVTALTIDSNVHLITGGTAPAIGGSCGTSPSIAGTDGAGKVTTGSVAPTSCTVTFNKTWTNAPACIGVNETTSNLLRATSTTTTLVLAGTLVAGDVLAYVCSGY